MHTVEWQSSEGWSGRRKHGKWVKIVAIYGSLLSLSRLLEKFSFIPWSLSKYIYKMVGYSSSSTIPTLSLSRLTLMTRRNLIKVKLEKNVYLMNVAQLSFPFSHSLLAEHFFLWACKTFSLSLSEVRDGRVDDEKEAKRKC